jgi:hypothetical protein
MTGITAKPSRPPVLTMGLMVNAHSLTHRSNGEPAGEWQTTVIMAQLELARTRAGVCPGRTITVGENTGRRDEWTRSTGP